MGTTPMRQSNTPISGTKSANTIRSKSNKTSKDQGAIPKIPKTQIDDFIEKDNSLNSQSTQRERDPPLTPIIHKED